MRLSLHTDYALRTLMYLASFSERATAKEIAELYRISSDHLAKVVSQLNRLGYVRSIRGLGGGIELAKSPAEIRIGEVVLAFEGNMHLLECVGRDQVCVIESFCKLRGVLAEAERLQAEYLNRVTLQDVIPPRTKMKQAAKGEPGR